MKYDLPQVWIDRMNALLKSDFTDFLSCYENNNYVGLRINSLKNVKLDDLAQFHLSPIPWSTFGYYYDSNTFPGKHAYHNAGLYYIQEPSAQSVVEILNPQPNDLVIDLCAAPGGKSTQIGQKLQNTGLLVSNEIISSRAKILSSNIERMGIRNAIVTNEEPSKLANIWGPIFDKVLVDAPCSGDGMFRKNENAIKEWSMENVNMCASRQLDILTCALNLLKPNGILCYSTCSFSPEEDEKCISAFIKTHPNVKLIEIPKKYGMSKGMVFDDIDTSVTARLFPHKLHGEGHFVALMQKTDGIECKYKKIKIESSNKFLAIYREWEKKYLNVKLSGNFLFWDNNIWLVPDNTPTIDKIKVERIGLHIGQIDKNIFIPNHALALALNTDDFKNIINLDEKNKMVDEYLKGNTIECTQFIGWGVVAINGYILGFGKANTGIMKNHYPKGLRNF